MASRTWTACPTRCSSIDVVTKRSPCTKQASSVSRSWRSSTPTAARGHRLHDPGQRRRHRAIQLYAEGTPTPCWTARPDPRGADGRRRIRRARRKRQAARSRLRPQEGRRRRSALASRKPSGATGTAAAPGSGDRARPARRRRRKSADAANRRQSNYGREREPGHGNQTALVKELRERTGAGMMECKKALIETNGDIDAAGEWLRKSGSPRPTRRPRVAAEGRVAIRSDEKAGPACWSRSTRETDFVAKDDNFLAFVDARRRRLEPRPATSKRCWRSSVDGRTVEDPRPSSSRRSARTSPSAASPSSRAAGRVGTYRARHAHRRRSSSSRAATSRSRAISRCTSLRSRRATSRAPTCRRTSSTKSARSSGEDRGGEEAARDPGEDRRRQDRKFVNEVTLTGQLFVKDDKKRVRDGSRRQGEGRASSASRSAKASRKRALTSQPRSWRRLRRADNLDSVPALPGPTLAGFYGATLAGLSGGFC